ncbi:MAG: helix-turn-helix domain-containing protein [Gammaproteobacteria bacterium]|nr:helix-turn-helix domain-containing protein [Gammaproteobacteria bacterium]
MDVAEDNANNPARPAKIGPGERLQAERIKKGLSLEDVAGRMHLSNNILEAIEENNFDEITAPIFVKGYLRAYARIVALNEDDMIEQYLEMYSEEDPPISSTSNMVPELSVKDARIKWTTYLVVLVLGVLLAAWWWNKQQAEEAPISLDAQTSGVAESASAEEPVVSSEVQTGSETLIDSTETAETLETPELESVAITPAPATESSMAVEPEATVVETATGTLANPGRSTPAGLDKMRIIVHADTWADVKDSSNYQLVYDLLRADTSMELTGEAPFAVFLGNGHGVEILFNGEEIEISPKIRDDNTARLNIGG